MNGSRLAATVERNILATKDVEHPPSTMFASGKFEEKDKTVKFKEKDATKMAGGT